MVLDVTTSDSTGKKDEALLKIISDGKNKMPAYSKQLKPEDQIAVLRYMRSLAPKKEGKTEADKSATQ